LTQLDLAPARWIWLPCQRTLQNTVVLFRRCIDLAAAPRSAHGWIAADSRYRLWVNGVRVQSGPAPCDPRDQEADPLDLATHLRPGRNVIAIEVLYYGTGDGTWPAGSPGLLLNLDIDGVGLVSDATWRCEVDRAWTPGRYKRWYLRALQEIVDSRRHPHGWREASFDDARWLFAHELPGRADRPSLCAGAHDYQGDAAPADPAVTRLRARTIPLLDESRLIDGAPTEVGTVHWHRDPEDWFEFRMEGALSAERGLLPQPDLDGAFTIPATASGEGRFLTFALDIERLGFPRLELEAPAGAVVEIITHEAHDPVGGPAWLDTAWHCWSRLVCRGGTQVFEAIDYECFRWMQVHVRSPDGPVRIHRAGMRERAFPFAAPHLRSEDPALDRLFAACVQTLRNSAHDQICDGSARERQQYAGDCGQQLIAVRGILGERALPARYLRTWAQGQTHEGWFLDCWPAYDRLNRIAQRQLGITPWGPILDHGIGFVHDHYFHWMETGDLEASRAAWPALVRHLAYLRRLRSTDGLLPVEDLGIPSVWMDHIGFRRQRDKRCAFNLAAIAMLRHAMAPLALAFGKPGVATDALELAGDLLQHTLATFWDPSLRLFVDNRPWLAEEDGPRTHDRSLASAVLYGLVPEGGCDAIAAELAAMPARCGRSYPANAGYRLSALVRLGRPEVVVGELRSRWAMMPSVRTNCTVQEDWDAYPDCTKQWSHCSLAPANVLIQDLIGLRPTAPGFAAWRLEPKLGGLPATEVDIRTVRGDFRCRVTGDGGLRVAVPAGAGPGEVVLPGSPARMVAPGEVLELRPG
jgi:alpha-L-rhamnosidase